MANVIPLKQDILSEEERARIVAKRAIAEPDFPFDGPLGAAMVLAQLELAASLARPRGKPRPAE